MVKIIDLDKAFQNYIEKYVMENIGKIDPEDIENKVSDLYLSFGDEINALLDGFSPNEYYKQYSTNELLDALSEHVDKGVPVSDYLCEAIIEKSDIDLIVKRLSGDLSEQFTIYLLNLLSDCGGKLPIGRIIEFFLYDYSDTIFEIATEMLKNQADDVKDRLLELFEELDGVKKEAVCEILSNAKVDERITKLLLLELKNNPNKLPLYVSFLTKYNDEHVLPFLYEKIEDEKISYADFEELRFAIESLGGSYDKKRDFSQDKSYKKIVGKTKISS